MVRSERMTAGRRMLVAAVAALALGLPTAAYPVSLAQLLKLPLEQLLRLEITSRAAVAGVAHGR